MKSNWEDLCLRLRVKGALPLYDDLKSQYEEPSRFYHTFKHIKYMLSNIPEDFRSELFELAVWYHDIIYDPHRSDNEQKSIQYFSDHWSDYLTHEEAKTVSRLIEVTTHGKVKTKSSVERLMVDLDLLILSESADIYEEYATNIRKEYKHYPDEEYQIGRRKVLGLFLDSPIYQSEFFRSREDHYLEFPEFIPIAYTS